ncbi:sodium/hydrogen exchanger 9-like [Arapaima gigas]
MADGLERQRQHSAELLLLTVTLSASVLTACLVRTARARRGPGLRRFPPPLLLQESGVVLLYGERLVLGLILKIAASPWTSGSEEVHDCMNLNRTPPFLLFNITGHVHQYQHLREVRGPDEQSEPLNSVLHKLTFNPEIFFNLFLPPIIFHGAYRLNQRLFFSNIGSVLTFAFLGTLISCGIIGACMYGFVKLMVHLGHAADGDFGLKDCLFFGSLMSATDPVTVLAIFAELRVDPDLYILLFGESVLNDAVAIVLTYAISTYSMSTVEASSFFLSAGHFLLVFIGSFGIGFSFTIVTALISFSHYCTWHLTKFTHLNELPLLETGLFFLLSWSTFLSAEACGLSGIVAVMFCGITQAHYTFHNLSTEAKIRTKQLFEILNFLAENFIFCYIGLALFTFQNHVFQAVFTCGAFLSILVARVCNIYPLSFLLNLGRRTKIPINIQHMLMFSGLRGAVAFALAAQDTTTKARQTIFSTTLLVVLLTVWVLGSTTIPMLSCLEIRVGMDPAESPRAERSDLSQAAVADSHASMEDLQAQASWLQRRCHNLDSKYVKPVLTHCGPPLTSTLPLWCEPLARLLTSPHAYENQEQLKDTEDKCSSVKMDETEDNQGSTGDKAEEATACTQGDDLLEGDLGLGQCVKLPESFS